MGLRLRSVDVLTAHEDGAALLSDAELMDRATALNRVLLSFDGDLLAEAAKRQRENKAFSGLIYSHPLQISIGQTIKDLELIAKAAEPDDLRSRVEFLPL